jgi:hypothetical protein
LRLGVKTRGLQGKGQPLQVVPLKVPGNKVKLADNRVIADLKEEIMSGRGLSFCSVLFSFVVLSFLTIVAPTLSHVFDISIQVSPNTLNIRSSSEVVTIHTSIAYSSVEGASVTLNNLPISWWKADNQGNFVAKFVMSEIKALANTGELQVPGENELTLVGTTTDGANFIGIQTITVINVQPAGAGGK